MIAGKRVIFFSITCLGMSSLITQIVSLREFMTVLAGNELVLGMILGNWLLLTGFGTFLGRWAERLQKPLWWLVLIQITIAFLPLIHISIIRLLNRFFLPGLMLGLNETFIFSFLILFPYCLVSGFLLTLFSGLGGERRDAFQIGEVYVVDVIGDILGGILFSFLLVYFLSSYQILFFLLVINLFAAALVCRAYLNMKAFVSVIMLLALSVVGISLFDLEKLTSQGMFPGQKVISQKSTPYGHLVVTKAENQIAVYSNGIVSGSTENIIAAEESIHYGLSQHPKPERILMVSGGLNGGLREAVKYPLFRIDYVELDPAVIELVREYALPENDERIELIAYDARRYLRSKNNFYDAVLIDLADPSTAQLNRFYTVEFFQEVRKALKKDGVFSFSMTGAENYATKEISYLASSVYNSLVAVFSNVLIIPGENQFFVASDQVLSYQIDLLLKKKNIVTSYVTHDYLQAKLTRDRIDTAYGMMQTSAGLNEDFRPAGYFMLMRYWLKQFQGSLILPLLIIGSIVLGLMYLISSGPGKSTQFAVCSSGFSGLGLEVVLIIAFQVCYGYVYQQMGIIITGFLCGTALGGGWSVRRGSRPRVLILRLDLLLVFIAIILALLLPEVRDAEVIDNMKIPPSFLFAVCTALIGFLVGAQFPVAATLTFQKVEQTAGNLYTLDYLGAALGGLVISTFAIPLLGITSTCYILAGIKLVSSLLLWFHRNEVLSETALQLKVHHGVGGFPAMATLFFLGALGLTIYSDSTSTALYSISFLPYYHWTLLMLVIISLFQAMEMDPGSSGLRFVRKLSRTVFHHTWIRLFRWINFIGFSLVVFFPLFRCYFKIPYLFCHVCPRQCVFGYLRPYLVPAALIMNFGKRHWCINCCPLGTMFDCQAQAFGKARRIPPIIRWPIGVSVTLFTAYSYFRLKADLAKEVTDFDDWYTIFFANTYAPGIIVLAVAATLVAMSFWVRRPFCDSLCPVGVVSDLILKSEQKIIAVPAAEQKQEASP